jgi:hypothetical protein
LSAARNAAGISSLRADLAAAFATHPSIKSLNDSELSFKVQEVLDDPGFAHRDDPSVPSHLAATGAKPSLDVGDDDDDGGIAALVEEAERRYATISVKTDDIRYPDCE